MKIVKEIESFKRDGTFVTIRILADDWANYSVDDCGGYYFQTLNETNDFIRMRHPRKRAYTFDKTGSVIGLPLVDALDIESLKEREGYLWVLLKNGSRFRRWFKDQYHTRYETKINKQRIVLAKGNFVFEVFAFVTNDSAVGIRIYNQKNHEEKTMVVALEVKDNTLLHEIDKIVETFSKEDNNERI